MMRLEEPLDKESVWHIWSKEREREILFRSMGLIFIFIDFLLWHLIFRLFLIDLIMEGILVIKARILL